MQKLNNSLSIQKIESLEQSKASNLIRELRQLTGLTQERFAVALGVTYTTVNRWENGHMQPSRLALKQIQAMLKKLEMSTETDHQQRFQSLLTQYFPEDA